MSADRAELEEAFRQTRYVVLLPDGELELRIGRRDADAERRLVAQTGMSRGWHLVTPCNPEAKLAPPATNDALLTAFHLELRAWGGAWHATLTRAARPGWPEEPGALIVDADPAWVQGVAARFRQRAYVSAELGAAPRLVWLG